MGQDPPFKIAGLTVEQFAGVTAATLEGIPLDAVLAQEQISLDAWRAAEPPWREALADRMDLQIDLVRSRRVAEGCLDRKVSPIDTDPSAWKTLLAALAAVEDPKVVLASRGITLSDVSRVGRRWKARAADPAIAAQLAAASSTAALPPVFDVGALELARFPWSPPPTPAAAVGERTGPTPDPHDLGPAKPVVQQRASFQNVAAPVAPALAPDDTADVDGRAIVAQITRGPLPFDRTRPPTAPAQTSIAARAALLELERGDTALVDGGAIRAALMRGAIPFANGVDEERTSVRGRVERFAMAQFALATSADPESTLRVYGLTREAWEQERSELAGEVARSPELAAAYQRAWRDAGRD